MEEEMRSRIRAKGSVKSRLSIFVNRETAEFAEKNLFVDSLLQPDMEDCI